MEVARRHAEYCARAAAAVIVFCIFAAAFSVPWADIAFTIQAFVCNSRDGTYSRVPCAKDNIIWEVSAPIAKFNATRIVSHLSRIAITRDSIVYFGGPAYFCAESREFLGACGLAREVRANGIVKEIECIVFAVAILALIIHNAGESDATARSVNAYVTRLIIAICATICACVGFAAMIDHVARARSLGRARFSSMFALILAVELVELASACAGIAFIAWKLRNFARLREGEKNAHNIEM